MLSDQTAVGSHAGYTLHVLPAPLPAASRAALQGFLGHKGEPWLWDIEARYAGDGPDTCYLAARDGQLAAHIWIGRDRACPAVGTFGHVYTDPAHRGQGLASALTELALRHSRDTGCRYLGLGVGNPAAARIYTRYGFVPVLAPEPEGSQTMIWGAASAAAARAALYPADAALDRRPFSRATYSGACLLLSLLPGAALPLLAIADGRAAEGKLIRAQRPECMDARLTVAVDAQGLVHGILLRRGCDSNAVGTPAALTLLG